MKLASYFALSRAARLAVAISLIVVAGFWSFATTFSDYPASWSLLTWFAYLVAWHLPSAFVVGLLVPTRWYLALGTAWGSLGLFATPSILLPLLASVLAAGYLGGRLSRWLHAR